MLTEHLQAVTAYADYLQGEYITRDHRQFPMRNQAVCALRNAAMAVLAAAQDWPELEKRDGQHIVLQAPCGARVLYTYEYSDAVGVERLTILD